MSRLIHNNYFQTILRIFKTILITLFVALWVIGATELSKEQKKQPQQKLIVNKKMIEISKAINFRQPISQQQQLQKIINNNPQLFINICSRRKK